MTVSYPLPFNLGLYLIVSQRLFLLYRKGLSFCDLLAPPHPRLQLLPRQNVGILSRIFKRQGHLSYISRVLRQT